MALSNLDRVNKGMELLHAGLYPYVTDSLKTAFGEERWIERAIEGLPPTHQARKQKPEAWDTQMLLQLMNRHWKGIFDSMLGHAERAQSSELIEFRNRAAHQNKTNAFDTNDAGRVLDNVSRLLRAIGAPQAEEAEIQRDELFRIRYDENNRKKAKTIQTQLMDTTNSSGLPAWRQVIEPHEDVAKGTYQQAEFAADLWQVYRGSAINEYGKPVDFFSRTHLTVGIRKLLHNALLRLNGQGGDPIINLQTNFGGGKTHSLIALYHLFSGADFSSLHNLEKFFQQDAKGLLPPAAMNRAVIVGEKIERAKPDKKPDGTMVRTIWGEIAWQLGKQAGYEIVREADEAGVNPGAALEKLFQEFGPCLILIDEWVAYLRELNDSEGQITGSYGTHMSFAQALCGAAKTVKNTLLVVSIPSSDYEMGGERGKRAAAELKHLFARTESPWGVATTEESFEIVTRRLFAPITTREAMEQRDVVARAMGDFYRANKRDFPAETANSDYEQRIKASYPIHPELFDALASQWASLESFQKTRGILRLMAKIIQILWESGDNSALIMPGLLPLEMSQVQEELMRYLDEPWRAVIHKDVDGPNSLPQIIDRETNRFNQIHKGATRRVARTLFFSSAPVSNAAQKGIDEQHLKLGAILPGENIPVFTDALRQLLNRGTYIYAEHNRYWYDTQNNVNREAEDRATHVGDDDAAAAIYEEVKKWVELGRGQLRPSIFPASSSDIADDNELKLVVLGTKDAHTSGADDSPALQKAQDILNTKGSGARMYRNTLLYVAPDAAKMAELMQIACRYLAWKSIDKDANRGAITLSNHQMVQVKDSVSGTLNALTSRLHDVFSWLLVPYQERGGQPQVEWEKLRLNGNTQEPVAERVIKKLSTQGLVNVTLGPTVLRGEMDKHNLWREKDYISLRELRDYFTKYLFLPKLKNHSVLQASIEEGIKSFSWHIETFAYSDGWDEEKSRFKALIGGEAKTVHLDSDGILVKPDVASAQKTNELAEQAAASVPKPQNVNGGSNIGATTPYTSTGSVTAGGTNGNAQDGVKPIVRKRFHGFIEVNPQRFFRDAEKLEKEILKHLLAADGANIKVTLHIEADTNSEAGFDTDTIRVIKENGRTLGFGNTEFE